MADKIRSVGRAEHMALVGNRDRLLPLERNVSLLEFKLLGVLIHPFKKTISQFSMNLHGRANDSVRFGVFL